MVDYYKTLGVSMDATPEEIKKAFKKLAREHHPDTNKGSKKSEEKFKVISEAYEVLSNKESRAKYDRERRESETHHNKRWARTSPRQPQSQESPEYVKDFFERVARGGFGGAVDFEDFTSPFFGDSGFSFGGSRRREPSATLKVPLSTAYRGGVIQVTGMPGGAQNINIPPGTGNGSTLSTRTLEGSFNLIIEVEGERPYSLKGNTLERELNINLFQACLGGKVEILDPGGKGVVITIPEGTQPGCRLKLSGMGLANADMFIRLNVQIPKNLSQSQKDEIAKLGKILGQKF